jgi:hypothetical protein
MFQNRLKIIDNLRLPIPLKRSELPISFPSVLEVLVRKLDLRQFDFLHRVHVGVERLFDIPRNMRSQTSVRLEKVDDRLQANPNRGDVL